MSIPLLPQPLRPPYENASTFLKERALVFHDSPDSMPLVDCLQKADANKDLMTFRKETFDVRTRSETQLPELICYSRKGHGLGLKNVAATAIQKGKKIDKRYADRLDRFLEKSGQVLEMLKRNEKLLEQNERLAYSDMIQTLLSRLNFWLHRNRRFWTKMEDEKVGFGPFEKGRKDCSYSNLCSWWHLLSKVSPKWQKDIVKEAMHYAEDQYLREVVSTVDPSEFSRELYFYITRGKSKLERNLVAHEFGTAIESTLTVSSGTIRLLDNFPAGSLDEDRRDELLGKLKAMNNPPEGLATSFQLQKIFLRRSLSRKYRKEGESNSPPPPERTQLSRRDRGQKRHRSR